MPLPRYENSTPAGRASVCSDQHCAGRNRHSLKRVRAQRDVTLTELAEAIPESTLSRLKCGQRKPILELLLRSQARKIPLDELVATPEAGDARIRIKRQARSARIVGRSQRPHGVHTWKVVMPARFNELTAPM